MIPGRCRSPVNSLTMIGTPPTTTLDELAEFFLRRYRAGDPIDIDELAEKYPELSTPIREYFPTLLILEQFKGCDDDREANSGTSGTTTENAPEIPGFQIERCIARGGMGIVYEARQLSLDRSVALKVLPAELSGDPMLRRRFEIEARAAARLHHTNIVPIFEIGEAAGVPYYAMQLIEGQPLDQLISVMASGYRNGKLSSARTSKPITGFLVRSIIMGLDHETSNQFDLESDRDAPSSRICKDDSKTGSGSPENNSGNRKGFPADSISTIISVGGFRGFARSVAKIGKHVAGALAFAHGHNILHRDIKPSNLLLDVDGNVWVADFGLARLDDQGLTEAGEIVGTVRYMAPERFEGRCDVRSEVYSLGMTMYEMLVLRPAFESSEQLSLIEQIRSGRPPHIREHNRRVPRDLQTIVMKSIEKEPRHRYQTAGELEDDLQRFIEGRPIQARSVSPIERFAIWSKRNPVVASLTCLLMAGLLIGSFGSSIAALKFRAMAAEQTELTRAANTARLAAEQSSAENAQNLYYAETTQAADRSMDPRGYDVVREIVDRWRPSTDAMHQVGWEWYWLNAHTHQASEVIDTVDFVKFGRVKHVEWSPDGRQLAWCQTGSINIIDRHTNEHRSLPCVGEISNFDFSADGKYIASASRGGCEIWDWKSETRVRTLQKIRHVVAVAWHPKRNWLAFQVRIPKHKTAVIKIWDIDSECELVEIPDLKKGDLMHIAFNAQGTVLAGFGAAQSVKKLTLWDVESGKLLAETRGKTDRCIDWHPTDDLLAGGGEDGAVEFWDGRSTEPDKVPGETRGRIFCVDWQPTGDHVAIGGTDYAVRLLHHPSNRVSTAFIGHADDIFSLAWHPQRPLLASGSGDGKILIWNINDPMATTSLSLPKKPARVPPDARWHPDGKRFLIERMGQTEIRTQDGQSIGGYEKPFTVSGTSACWSSDGQFLAVRGGRSIAVTNGAGTEEIKRFSLPKRKSNIMLRDWNPRRCELLFIELDLESSDSIVYRWNLEQDAEPQRSCVVKGTYPNFAYGPDGDQIYCFRASKLFLVDLSDGSLQDLGIESPDGIRAIDFSPDGTRLAIGGINQKVSVFDMKTRTLEFRLSGHSDRVHDVGWHPAGKRIASACQDGRVIIWDTDTKRPAMILNHDGPVCSVDWSADGKKLIAASETTAKIWDATKGYALEESSE